MNHLTKFDIYQEFTTFRNSQSYESPNVSSVLEDMSVHYEGYLTFKMKSTSGAIELNKVGTIANLTASVQYKLENEEGWQNYIFNGANGQHIELLKDEIVRFKGVNTKFSHSSNTYYNFAMSGDFNARGDVTSLINGAGGDCALPNFAFVGLFSGCTSLLTPPKLPSTTLSKRCYDNLFKWCSSMKIAPELPAKNLSEGCYRVMFGNCYSLTKAPKLQATVMAKECYTAMFQHASALNDISEIVFPENTAERCFANMFNDCAITAAPELPATTLSVGCYFQMFNRCTSLVHSVPKIPATVFPNSSCCSMFFYCVNLIDTPKMNSAVTVNTAAMKQMFYACSSLTEFSDSALTAMNLGDSCYYNMFSYCRDFTGQVFLPATTMKPYCYAYMFAVCPSLSAYNYVLPAETLKEYCYRNMFAGTSLVNPVEMAAKTLGNSSCIGMYVSCVTLTSTPSFSAITSLGNGCFNYTFQDCISLTTMDELPLTVVPGGAYWSMFYHCRSLTGAPYLGNPTSVGDKAYQRMFEGCSNLTYIKAMFTSWPNGTGEWVAGVKSTGTFVANANASFLSNPPRGSGGIPNNWTIQTATE